MSTSKMTFEKNTEAQVNAVNIKTLSDRPNVVSRYGTGGLSATQLKERFDGFPALNREKINQIIDALNGAESTKYLGIGTDALSEFGVDNLYDLLVKMTTSDIAGVLKVDYMMAEDAQAVAYTLQTVISHIMQVNSNQHSAIMGNADEIAAVKNKAETEYENIAAAFNEHLGKIEANQSNISGHGERITKLESDNTTYQGRISTLEGDNTTNQADIDKLEGAAAEMLLWKLGMDIAYTQTSKDIEANSGRISTLETDNTINKSNIRGHSERINKLEAAYETLEGVDDTVKANITTIDEKLTAAQQTVDEHIEEANKTIAGIKDKVDGVFQDGTIKSDSIIIGEGEALGQHSVAGGTTDLDLIKLVLGSGYAELINKYGSTADNIPDSIISAILSATGANYTVAEFRQMIKVSPSKADGPLTLSYGTSNASYAPVSSSIGYNNTVGAKGYRVFNIGPATSLEPAELRISVGDIPKMVDSYVAPNPDILGEWQPGDRLYVAAGGKRFITKLIKWRVKNYDVGDYPGYRLQVERDVSDVTVESATSVSIPFDKTYYLADLNDNFVINLDRPTAGEVELGWGAIAMGALNTALGNSALALGYRNLVLGIFGTALGQENTAGDMALAGGILSEATGKGSIAFGNECKATKEYAVALGGDATASGERSFACGNNATASGDYSHAEGFQATASGEASHAEGKSTKASGWNSHAEGQNAEAKGLAAHAEGYYTTANGKYSHAEGGGTEATATYAHAEGYQTMAQHENSHASGLGTKTGRDNQTVVGEWNEIDENALYVVGNGNGPEDRSNAFTVNKDGTAYVGGNRVLVETNWIGAEVDNSGELDFTVNGTVDYEFYIDFSYEGQYYRCMLGALAFVEGDVSGLIQGIPSAPIGPNILHLEYNVGEHKLRTVVKDGINEPFYLRGYTIYYRLIHE